MDNEIAKRIQQWQQPPFDNETISEINQLVQQNNEKELYERFYTNLEFGTGGLRGIIGAGTNRMNIYTVGMATQGLANYILQKGSAAQGVVIAYDSRRMSDVFSKEAASILAANASWYICSAILRQHPSARMPYVISRQPPVLL